MQSSILHYWVFRWGLLLMGLAFGGLSTVFALRGEAASALVMVSVAAGLIVAVALWRDRVAVVTLTPNEVIVKVGSDTDTYPWEEVAQVRMMPMVMPPMYRIVLRSGTTAPVYCFAFGLAASFGPWVWDFSGFGEYAAERLRFRRLPSDVRD